MMANLRLVLDVEVKAGDQSHSSHSLPGLISLLNRLPEGGAPELVRGDIGWGTDTVMRDLEKINQSYLFKLKKTKNVINLVYKHHGLGEWTTVANGWEAKDDNLQLQGWEAERRVVIVRRQLSSTKSQVECGFQGCFGLGAVASIASKLQQYRNMRHIDAESAVKSHINLKRAWVDQNVCGAFQLCIGEAPSHFEESDGIASRVIATDSPFTVSDLKSLVSGAWACPLGAIYIELESGEVLNEITSAQYAQYVKNS